MAVRLARRLVSRGSLAETTLVNVALLGLGLVLSIISARALGPEGRGLLALALTVSGLASLVGGLGLQQALAYFVAGDPGRAPEGAGLAVIAGLAAGLAIGLIGVLGVLLLAEGPVVPLALALGLASVPPSLISGNAIGVIQGMQDLRRFNLLRLVAPAATAALFAIWAAAGQLSATTGVALHLFGVTLAAIWALLVLRRRSLVRRPPMTWSRRVLRYGLVVNMGAIAYAANRQLSIVVLAAVGTFEDVGVYSVAAGYGLPVMVAASAIAFHVLPGLAAETAPLARRRTALRELRTTLILTIPLAAGAFLAAPVLVPLAFGDEFERSVEAAQVLVAGFALLGIAHVLSEISRGIGRPAAPALAEALGAVLTVGLLIPVVPRHGALGAAVVALGSYAFVCAVLGAVVRRRLTVAS